MLLCFLLCTVFISFTATPSTAQTYYYYPVTHPSGTQNINGYNVTVTPSPSGAGIFNSFCGTGPYWIGLSGRIYPNPGSYKFEFVPAVANVIIRVAAMDDSEVVSFVVNNTPYPITGANLGPFPGSCNPQTALIVGGKLTGDPSAAILRGSGGEVTIKGNINSIEIHGNGVQNGSVFGLSFGGISADNNSAVCEGDILKLLALSTFPVGTTVSYYWTGPQNFTSNLQNPVIPNAKSKNEGWYFVKTITPKDTFIDSTYVTIDYPIPVTEIVYDEPVCAGINFMLSDTTTLPDVSRYWEGPNGFSDSVANPVIQDIQSIYSGLYKLTTILGACSYTTEAEITVYQPVYTNLFQVICSSEPLFFNGETLNQSGTYYDTLVAANGCDSFVTLELVVLPAPDIGISIKDNVSLLCAGDSVSCIANGSVSYQWYNNNQLIGSNKEERIYLSNLSNEVIVVGRNKENDCSDTARTIIHVNSCCKLFIPNAFSPNGDGLNDHFGPSTNGHIKTYQLSIYNRYGQRVFFSSNIQNQWNGIINNTPADAGTYYYYITAECMEGTKLKRKGDITLLR